MAEMKKDMLEQKNLAEKDAVLEKKGVSAEKNVAEKDAAEKNVAKKNVLKKVPVREQDPKVRATNFEEVFQHAHVQRLAKPARARKQIDLSPARHQVNDQPGFIDIIEILLSNLLKIFNTNGQLLHIHSVCLPLPTKAYKISMLVYHLSEKAAS